VLCRIDGAGGSRLAAFGFKVDSSDMNKNRSIKRSNVYTELPKPYGIELKHFSDA
jgi:hypothetical protein